jgi:hypothetical protein
MLQRTYLAHQLFTVTPSTEQQLPFFALNRTKIPDSTIYDAEYSLLYVSEFLLSNFRTPQNHPTSTAHLDSLITAATV